jgi:hypothetical protein
MGGEITLTSPAEMSFPDQCQVITDLPGKNHPAINPSIMHPHDSLLNKRKSYILDTDILLIISNQAQSFTSQYTFYKGKKKFRAYV